MNGKTFEGRRHCGHYILDVNRDGKQDILVNQFEAGDDNAVSRYRLYLNNHDGVDQTTAQFIDVGDFTLSREYSTDKPLRIADYNGDGYPDILTIIDDTSSTDFISPHKVQVYETGFGATDLDDPQSLIGKVQFNHQPPGTSTALTASP